MFKVHYKNKTLTPAEFIFKSIRFVYRKIRNILSETRLLSMLLIKGVGDKAGFEKFTSYIKEKRRNKIYYVLYHSRDYGLTPLEIDEYNGKKTLDYEQTNKFIGEAIEAGRPFMAGRYGAVELNAMWRVRNDNSGFVAPVDGALHLLHYNAGFFPKVKDAMIKFADVMKRATYQVDLMGIWLNPLEEYVLRIFGNNPEYCPMGNLTPIFSKNPWTAKLEGKKVLVIHPFYKTIPEQYKKRKLLFDNEKVLPDFELIMQRAIQTIAGNKDDRFISWFEALDYMFDEAMKKNFDVAIIGCGAYGFPLAAKIKKAGKIAIHIGGNSQLLFGIKGSRWEEDFRWYKYRELMKREHWVRPSERPSGFETIENACYW